MSIALTLATRGFGGCCQFQDTGIATITNVAPTIEMDSPQAVIEHQSDVDLRPSVISMVAAEQELGNIPSAGIEVTPSGLEPPIVTSKTEDDDLVPDIAVLELDED